MIKNKTLFTVKKAALAVSLSLLLGATQANASGLNTVLNNAFDSMANVSQPGVFETQRRGVLSGGSAMVRNKIVNTELVSLVPPSWKGGCGGIDLFMGSFSFINGEQFVQLLRAVAANAAGYAFQVALDNVCGDCMKWINNLQKGMQALNQFAGNSCQLAQGIVNDSLSAFDNIKHNSVSLKASFEGFQEDWSAAWTQSDGKSSETALKENDPTLYNQLVTGNTVWRALNYNRGYDWVNGGDDELLEAMMSLTGTVVVGDQVDDDNGEKTNPQRTFPPVLDLTNFVHGGNNVEIYRCDDRDQDKCLNPVKQTQNIEGLAIKISNVLLGADGSIGVVAKFANPIGAQFTAEEQNVMSWMPEAVGAVIRNLSAQSESAGRMFANKAATTIAIEIGYDIANQMIKATELSLNNQKDFDRKAVQELFKEARQSLFKDYDQLTKRDGTISDLLDLADRINHFTRKADVIQMETLKSGNTNTVR